MLFDILLKIPTGCILDAHYATLKRLFFPLQFGINLPSGTDKLVHIARSLANTHPTHLFIATDIKNAFGNISRSHTYNALLQHCPTLAYPAYAMWFASFSYNPTNHTYGHPILLLMEFSKANASLLHFSALDYKQS